MPINETGLSPVAVMFLTTLRTYGAYVVDNAGGFTFYAEDIHTGNLDLTNDQVNQLIGQPPGTALPPNKTKWQLVLEQLNLDLEAIPLAYGPWTPGQDPTTVTITTANFEVVSNAGADPCPQCSGTTVLLENITFPAGIHCSCTASVSITTGQGVTIPEGATVTFTAPVITTSPEFHVEEGAAFTAAQE